MNEQNQNSQASGKQSILILLLILVLLGVGGYFGIPYAKDKLSVKVCEEGDMDCFLNGLIDCEPTIIPGDIFKTKADIAEIQIAEGNDNECKLIISLSDSSVTDKAECFVSKGADEDDLTYDFVWFCLSAVGEVMDPEKAQELLDAVDKEEMKKIADELKKTGEDTEKRTFLQLGLDQGMTLEESVEFYNETNSEEITLEEAEALLDGLPSKEAKYLDVGEFKEGRALVIDLDNNKFHIDLNGDRVYPENYVELWDFSEGAARARLSKDKYEYFHIDLDGNRIYEENYADVNDFSEGKALVKDSDGSWLVIDEEGNKLFDVGKDIYASPDLQFSEGRLAVQETQDSGYYLDENGNRLNDKTYAIVKPFKDGKAQVKDSKWDDWYSIDLEGNRVSE